MVMRRIRVTHPASAMPEMNTPAKPPDRAEVSDPTPAAPAMTATMNDHLSGL